MDMALYWTIRDIPHCYLGAIPVHVVYRVHDCAPVMELRKLSDELAHDIKALRKAGTAQAEALQRVLEEHLYVYDALLDAQDQSKYILKDGQAAQLVIDSWLNMQERGLLVVYAICVMGNHVHVLLRGVDGRAPVRMGGVVRKHKSFTSNEIKRVCHFENTMWDTGFFDRYVRPGTFWAVLAYVLKNPVKAGLVGDWTAWGNTYVDGRCLAKAQELGIAL